VKLIARLVDRMMVIFPFEEAIYHRAGVPVVFVGHPLLDSEPGRLQDKAARAALGLGEAGRVLALLPGSRRGEVAALLPIQLAAAARLRRERPDLHVVIPVAATVPAGLVDEIVHDAQAAWARPVHERFHAALDGADAAIVASGTATLQAGIRCVPMVVTYRIHPITAWLGRRLVRVSDIALVNLVAGRRIVTELIQEACTPERIAQAVAPLLDDPAVNRAQREALGVVRHRLGEAGAFARAASLLLEQPVLPAKV
jgi:lipid-A-disaccharide synthase